MATAVADREPYHIKLYNLPQRIEGGIKIYGAELVGINIKDPVLLFDHLDGMYANCTIEGTDKETQLSATTPLVEYKDGYMIEEEPEVAE